MRVLPEEHAPALVFVMVWAGFSCKISAAWAKKGGRFLFLKAFGYAWGKDDFKRTELMLPY